MEPGGRTVIQSRAPARVVPSCPLWRGPVATCTPKGVNQSGALLST
jgi:hypothetical protein